MDWGTGFGALRAQCRRAGAVRPDKSGIEQRGEGRDA